MSQNLDIVPYSLSHSHYKACIRHLLTDFLRWFLTPLPFDPDAPVAFVEEEAAAALDEDLESCLEAPLLLLLAAEPCTGVTMYLSLRISSPYGFP